MHAVYTYTDQELVAALQEDRSIDAAVGFIYRQHYGILEHVVVSNKGTKDDAADIFQETIVAFIEIVQQQKFRGEASVRSFLYTITKNLWFAELRKRTSADNRNRIFEKAKDGVEQETVQHLLQRESDLIIQQLFQRLGDTCRQLLIMVYYEDLSMKEILGIIPGFENEQVLRNKKYKCMKQLEKMIEDNASLKTQLKNALHHAR